jgi:hypothetical protein
MLIYNVTAHVAPSIETLWLDWMENQHFPELHTNEKIVPAKIYKIKSGQDPDGVSYAVQYCFENNSKDEPQLKEVADKIWQKVQDKFGDRVLFFRTELELIKEYS